MQELAAITISSTQREDDTTAAAVVKGKKYSKFRFKKEKQAAKKMIW